MPTIEQSKSRYLHAPRLIDRAGEPALRTIAWEPEGERLVDFELDHDAAVTGESASAIVPAIVALDARTGDPSADAATELEAWDGDARVVVHHHADVSEVVLERDGVNTTVFRARGIAVAPAVATAIASQGPAGTWVAFHHDVREDTGASDVAKWIALRFVTREGRVLEPSAPMTDRDRDREGVEQSFEFPALAVGRDGAVTLFGRGSHDFYRQDLNAAGFTPRKSLSDGEWGSRGRRIGVGRRRDGSLLVARRDRMGIVVDVQPEPAGGMPALQEAVVDLTSGIAPRGAERRARDAADPALRWGFQTYFGDIQQHSAHSDGIGSAEEAYLRARYRYDDDFVALTDHESFLGKRTGPGEWTYLQDVADRFEEPGSFATLLAYEWTGARYPGPGHKCVYVPERGLELLSRDVLPRGPALVEALAQQRGLASPHHIGWTGCDEEAHDPVTTPVWEICSCHGCYEHADHPLGQRGELRDQLVDVMLRKGHRFGFTASSDSHGLLYHHGEARKRDPYRTGLTAIQAPSLDRAAVLDALRTRRCYATSGVKILLDVTVDGAPMGSTIRASGSALVVEVRARGTAKIARVDLVGPDGVLESVAIDADEADFRRETSAGFVYARVVQTDGEMAWSSPVFVDA
jgi:hypothetical protein